MKFKLNTDLNKETWDIQKNKVIKKIQSDMPKNKHQLVFMKEKRKGKLITLIGKFYITEQIKKDTLKLLKTKLSCGGTIKNEWIELQGDVKKKVIDILTKDQWKFKNKG